MFKNKTLQLKVVDAKTTDPLQLNAPPKTPIDTQVIEVIKEGSKYAAMLIGAYMAADTLRQVTIYTACHKIK